MKIVLSRMEYEAAIRVGVERNHGLKLSQRRLRIQESDSRSELEYVIDDVTPATGKEVTG